MLNVKHSLLSDLRIVTLNLHGFKGNWSYLQTLLDSYDIVFVQEIWLLECELHLLHDLSREFTVYARTGMAHSVASGIVKGRPYGGVAVLVRNNLSRYITFCCHDDDGRVICVKLNTVAVKMLFFGCYFPYNDHSNEYVNKVADVVGFVESICQQYSGYKVCVLGDLNFECNISDAGFCVCADMAGRYKLAFCDDLASSHINYT